MTYQEWRTAAIKKMYDSIVDTFVSRYKAKQPVVVLLPGGMGSQLDRSMRAYNEQQITPQYPPYNPATDAFNLSYYDTIWLDLETIFLGKIPLLKVNDDGSDDSNRTVAASGPLRFSQFSAYDETARYFQEADFNYVVFSYDWRRSLGESAGYLKYFLSEMQSRVEEKHNEDPLPNLTLLAHSQGGLVAKIFLHMKSLESKTWFKKLVTVATPFYGTSSHQCRYFVGEDLLAEAPIPMSRSMMVEIISSFPGPYSLMFLPKSIFHDYGSEIGLKRYPIRTKDREEGNDPYSGDSIAFYPASIRREFLEEAGETYKIIAQRLPEFAKKRVYNICSVAKCRTAHELIWHCLPESFDPDQDICPVESGKLGSGDGTVPEWSAYHMDVPDDNRIRLEGASHDHVFLMEDSVVLKQVYALITSDDGQNANDKVKDAPEAHQTKVSCEGEVREFCMHLADGKVSVHDKRLKDPALWRGIYRLLVARD